MSTTFTCLPSIASTLIELSARLAISARFPARLIDMPEGCLPTVIVSIRRGGFVVSSITCSLLAGPDFQPGPSAVYSTESATSASWPLGVIARLVGGPKIEFESGRVVTIFGLAGSVPMSTITTASLPGALSTSFPPASHTVLLSIPTTMYSGLPGAMGSVAQPASVATAQSSANERSRFITVPLLEGSLRVLRTACEWQARGDRTRRT